MLTALANCFACFIGSLMTYAYGAFPLPLNMTALWNRLRLHIGLLIMCKCTLTEPADCPINAMFDALPEFRGNILKIWKTFSHKFTSKSLDIVFDPFDSHRLILQTKVSGHAGISSRQEPEWSKAIVHRHHNHIFSVHEVVGAGNTRPTRSGKQTTTVDVNENR